MSEFWVVAQGGELDGAVGLLQLDGEPAGAHLVYRGERHAEIPYVVTPERTTLPDGRPALVARRECSAASADTRSTLGGRAREPR